MGSGLGELMKSLPKQHGANTLSLSYYGNLRLMSRLGSRFSGTAGGGEERAHERDYTIKGKNSIFIRY